MENKPEAWLRGEVSGVPPMLQPVAHALIQANEEIHAILNAFPDAKLWEQPSGVASVAFHVQHIAGVLDRLLTYARGGQLSNAQLKYLSEEGLQQDELTKQVLLDNLSQQISLSVDYLKTLPGDVDALTEHRGVGRKQVPSTVLGLLFHAAEHTMRHTGQLLVTARILMYSTNIAKKQS